MNVEVVGLVGCVLARAEHSPGLITGPPFHGAYYTLSTFSWRRAIARASVCPRVSRIPPGSADDALDAAATVHPRVSLAPPIGKLRAYAHPSHCLADYRQKYSRRQAEIQQMSSIERNEHMSLIEPNKHPSVFN